MNLEMLEKRKIIVGGIVVSILVFSVIFIVLKNNNYIENEDSETLAIKLSDDGENYTNVKTIPTSGYTLNTDKTKCFVNDVEDTFVMISYEDGKVSFSNLTKNGTKCNLYFDKKPSAADTILAGITPKTTTPDFTKVATTDEGVYATSDGMYGGTTYYCRGAVTNNYVRFANFCWRIVRINGDGSIRLIYDGTSCHANGTSTTESIAIINTAYNSSKDNSSYVGWSYTKGSQRPNDTNPQTGGTRAPIRVTLEDTWYKANITDKGYDGKVVEGKFCNDRNTKNNETWVQTGSANQYYAVYQRNIETMSPVTTCPNGDVYEVEVGLITADEVTFAGASGRTSNTSYYLYNGQYYWTMSPYYGSSYGASARAFMIDNKTGSLGNANVSNTDGVRPVINLSADIQFQAGGNGTIDTPYVVK